MYAIRLGDDGAELRPLEPWHAEEFLAHLDRGREFINRYVPFGSRATDVAGAREVLQRYADGRAADTASLHGLWLDGTLVGGVLTLNFDAANGTCEVGCWLEPAATGRGLVTRAMRVLVDWAVEQRGIHRVEWVAAAGNLPSTAVARRLGMTRDGVRREAPLPHGVRPALGVWSVLAPEGRAARAAADGRCPDARHEPDRRVPEGLRGCRLDLAAGRGARHALPRALGFARAGGPPAALSSLADFPELSTSSSRGRPHRVDSLLRLASARTGPRSTRLQGTAHRSRPDPNDTP